MELFRIVVVEMIVELVYKLGWKVSFKIVEYIFLGVVIDSGRF